jgi:hypothetical protein
MLNPFFLNGSRPEQNLLQSLYNEQIMMYGIEVHYLPRQYATTHKIIREVIESDFTTAVPLEAYVNTYEGYTGQGTILSKFGIENRDDLELTISRERWEDYVAPMIKGLPDGKLTERPKEGDLIYFPLGDRLFEIKFVEHEQPFYSLKKNYVYELRCELFRYEDEVLDTGIDAIDDEIAEIGYIQTMFLIGAGIGATGEAVMCPKGAVNDIYISNMGKQFRETPVVAFSSAPSGGITATGIASVSYDYPGCTGKSGVVDTILLTNAGCGYTVPPMITVQGGGGTGFAATVGIANSTSVRAVVVSNGGSGYTKAPIVRIGVYPTFDDTYVFFDSTEFTFSSSSRPIGQNNATGIATISRAGVVTDVYLTSGGDNYQDTPLVVFSPPAAVGDLPDGSKVTVGGSYIFNEVVKGMTSGCTARVKDWNANINFIQLGIIGGAFVSGEYLVGETSGACMVIGRINTDDIVSPYAANQVIEIAADQIIDFSSKNPFGMP